MGDDRVASVSREISKLYAENGRGTLGELVINFTEKIQVVNLLLYSRK
jgi:16S rRNA (cytidine1402-2'-O)-methyltransferase